MDHEFFMRVALDEALKARDVGEVPIGAVVVYEGEIIGRGHNRREEMNDPTAHAEMLAIRNAGASRRGWRLTGATLYATVEPCPMCMGAALQSRLERVVYGASDPKAGACGSVVDLTGTHQRFNHLVMVTGGILEKECRLLMKEFFQGLR